MEKKEIYEQIEKLEKEKIEYLECDDKASARRKEKAIEKLQNKIELINLAEIKEELNNYKKFISIRGLRQEFLKFIDSN